MNFNLNLYKKINIESDKIYSACKKIRKISESGRTRIIIENNKIKFRNFTHRINMSIEYTLDDCHNEYFTNFYDPTYLEYSFQCACICPESQIYFRTDCPLVIEMIDTGDKMYFFINSYRQKF